MPGERPRGVQETPRNPRTVRSVTQCVGKLTLAAYRAQSVLDCADCVVETQDVQEFLTELLPFPDYQGRRRRIPKRPKVKASNHPFSTLEKADSMSENKVVRLFAAAVNKHNLAPGLGMARCQNKPDKAPKKRRRKGEEPAEPPKVDTMRQKVDAAFYRADRVPKDSRPHWADQIVPAEFKSGKRGRAADPFATKAEHDDADEEQATDVDEQDDDELDDEAEELPELEEMEEEKGDEDEEDDEDEDEEPESGADDKPNVDAQATKEPGAQATPAKDVFGQITTYVDLLQAVQHRTAVFMLLVIGRRFRILRWDRAGVIVTPSVDYYEEPDELCDFLWRISHVSDTTLGFDPTAIRLSPSDPDWVKMEEYAVALESDVSSAPRTLQPGELEQPAPGSEESPVVFDYVRTMFAQSIADRRWPRYRLSVCQGSNHQEFLVGKPTFCASGAIGRGTRGFVAIDCQTGCFVWLKDAWRVSYEKVEPEGSILARLNADPEIKDVPTLLCHGDVLCQKTLTATWWEAANPLPSTRKSKRSKNAKNAMEAAPSSTSDGSRGVKRKREDEPESLATDYRADCPMRQHNHYRVVVKEVGLPLKKFRDGIQLVHILLDCHTTHGLAATRPGINILHRDISDSNIIIVPKVVQANSNSPRLLNWTGVLTDWEMSKPTASHGDLTPARQPLRSGDWQFKSAYLLNNSGGTTIPDELESIVLILIYYCVRYLDSSIERHSAVATFLDEFYDCFTVQDGVVKCGERKATLLAQGQLVHYDPAEGLIPICFNAFPLDYLIAQCLRRFSARYKILRHQAWTKRHTHTTPSVPPVPRASGDDSIRSYFLNKHRTANDEFKQARYEAVPDPPTVSSTALASREPPKPTQEDEKMAMDIEDHEWFRWIVYQCLTFPGWEKLRKVKDRVPKNWESPHSPIPRELFSARSGHSR
ncbi:hypothetical protein DICSQDRAFT_172068 [Dichomitus squalens LYAD-421 SS1]|uniref:Fungal-type protein kinase domain-containing protein n=1 Tax=Dichomitus squalens (strain LYAD-421) TaxID=732165 RepID=R7STB6_DICSQ|nr:uncharacterized protein DICSQDRAFT_172068 [Dichomitus squalens LYAD-421 SS1]EJF59474.1 hypothetical protein DICSQDRAFT_172068 [Dichomitus squalens LYAD-421 SS1]